MLEEGTFVAVRSARQVAFIGLDVNMYRIVLGTANAGENLQDLGICRRVVLK